MTLRRLSIAIVLGLACGVAQPARGQATSPTRAAQAIAAGQPAAMPATPIFDEDAPPRFSLPTESDRALWKKPGFRFGLGLVLGKLYGIQGPPNGTLIGPTIRGGVRLDETWSLMSSLSYLYARGSGTALQGLRFAGTLEPTWHATEHLSLAVGLGFGGIVEPSTSRPNPDPQPSTLDTSYTFPNARQPLPSCNGVGVAALARAEWTVVMGPRSATGLLLQMDGQWTGCVDDTGTLEPDSATPIVRRQWWGHLGGSLTWEILWR